MSKVMIIQPGAVGDIIICLPIAKYWHDQGYEVFWPVRKKFIKHFRQIDYVKTLVLDDDELDDDWLKSDVMKCLKLYEKYNFKYGLNLADRGPHPTAEQQWENFEQVKYRLSNVPFYEKHNFIWDHNTEKENYIYEKYASQYDGGYVFVHDTSSHGESSHLPEVSYPIVKCEDFSGDYNILDWYKVIVQSKEIYVTESSVWAFCDSIIHELSDSCYLLPREKMGRMTTISENWNRKYL